MTTVKIPLEHALHITKEKKTPQKEITENNRFMCSVADATVLEGKNISFIVSYSTKLVFSIIKLIFFPSFGGI